MSVKSNYTLVNNIYICVVFSVTEKKSKIKMFFYKQNFFYCISTKKTVY